MTTTKIQWTDRVWNPIRGCSKVSPGCANCYAERMAARFSGPGQPYCGLTRDSKWTGEARFVPEMLSAPLSWRKPCRVFVNSMSDLAHESLPVYVKDKILAVMLLTPRHTYQVLTKRPQELLGYLTDPELYSRVLREADNIRASRPELCSVGISDPSKFPAKWIHWGVSVENQESVWRIEALRRCPAAVRWVSCEPLLGAVDTKLQCARDNDHDGNCDRHPSGCPSIDWVVCGGESGPHARPMHPDWARSLRDQCREAGVPFWFKQWGAWWPAGSNLLDGVRHEMRPGERWVGAS